MNLTGFVGQLVGEVQGTDGAGAECVGDVVGFSDGIVDGGVVGAASLTA